MSFNVRIFIFLNWNISIFTWIYLDWSPRTGCQTVARVPRPAWGWSRGWSPRWSTSGPSYTEGGQIVVTFSIVQVQRSPFTFYPVLWSLVHYFIKVQSEVPCVWRVCRAGGGRGRSGRVSLPRPLQRCWPRAAAACCWSSLVLQCCSAAVPDCSCR